jgi:DNA adenine methylase
MNYVGTFQDGDVEKEGKLSADTPKPHPFLKWAGGKRALLNEITPRIPRFTGRYIEPFLGAGAVLFSLDAKIPKIANDFNADLIEVYEVIRDNPHELLSILSKFRNTKRHFLEVRAWDRSEDYKKNKSKTERAARFIFLNKTCFNGLYRVNSKGWFNVPFANLKNPDYVSTKNILAVSDFLNTSRYKKNLTTLMSGDYRLVTSQATESDFVYLDPPYDPISATSSFVAYQDSGFSKADQEDLRDEIKRLTELGVPILLSNSDTDFINKIYANKKFFKIEKVSVKRVISAKTTSRGNIQEVLINNFKAVGAKNYDG